MAVTAEHLIKAQTGWIDENVARRAEGSLTRRAPRTDQVTARLELLRLGVLVDGDSFLLHCLETLPEVKDGYTTLQCTFLVLRGLERFLRARVKVYLCFFDSHAPFCRSASYSAVRACIIEGLQRMASLRGRVETHQLRSWHEADSDWHPWLERIAIEERPCAMILDWDFEPALYLAEDCLDRGISVVDMSTFSLTGPCPSVEAAVPFGGGVHVRSDVAGVFFASNGNPIVPDPETPVNVQADGTVALSELYPVIRATGLEGNALWTRLAHMIALALQVCDLPLEARAFRDEALGPKSKRSSVAAYHLKFCRQFLSSLASAAAGAAGAELEHPEGKTDSSEHEVQGSFRQPAVMRSLRIIDLWDGRLIAVVVRHLRRIYRFEGREPDLEADFGIPAPYARLIDEFWNDFRDELSRWFQANPTSGGARQQRGGGRGSAGGAGGGHEGHDDPQFQPVMINCSLSTRVLDMTGTADNFYRGLIDEAGRRIFGPRNQHFHSNRNLPAPIATGRDHRALEIQDNHNAENDVAMDAQVEAFQAAAVDGAVGQLHQVSAQSRQNHPLAFENPEVWVALNSPEELEWDNDIITLGDAERAELGKATPEPWQLKMLQAVRLEKSLLVIAPTSSGKSWAAESAALKVLREDNGGLIVFVQPTNALVTQTYATVQQLVTDAGLNHGGYQVAAFTADIRPNFDRAYRCLVTNPQCLENLLLTPAQANVEHMLTRLKLVVFDEIHTIGLGADAENSGSTAETLERLLTMIRCPILCLTATMPDEDAFYNWLKQLKAAHQPNVGQGDGGGGDDGGAGGVAGEQGATLMCLKM